MGLYDDDDNNNNVFSRRVLHVKIKLQAMQDAPPLQLYPASDKFLKGKLQSTCKVSKGLAENCRRGCRYKAYTPYTYL